MGDEVERTPIISGTVDPASILRGYPICHARCLADVATLDELTDQINTFHKIVDLRAADEVIRQGVGRAFCHVCPLLAGFALVAHTPHGLRGFSYALIGCAASGWPGTARAAPPPHVRADVDPCVDTPAALIRLTEDLVAAHLPTRDIADVPGVDGDTGEHAMVPLRRKDVIVQNSRVDASEVHNAHIGGVDDRVAKDQMTRTDEGDAIRPVSHALIRIRRCTAGLVHMVTRVFNRRVSDHPVRTIERERCPAFNIRDVHIVHNQPGTPSTRVGLII